MLPLLHPNEFIEQRKILGLEVDKDVGIDDINKAYRQLALVHHPDKVGGSGEGFKNIKKAYDEIIQHLRPKEKGISQQYYDSFHRIAELLSQFDDNDQYIGAENLSPQKQKELLDKLNMLWDENNRLRREYLDYLIREESRLRASAKSHEALFSIRKWEKRDTDDKIMFVIRIVVSILFVLALVALGVFLALAPLEGLLSVAIFCPILFFCIFVLPCAFPLSDFISSLVIFIRNLCISTGFINSIKIAVDKFNKSFAINFLFIPFMSCANAKTKKWIKFTIGVLIAVSAITGIVCGIVFTVGFFGIIAAALMGALGAWCSSIIIGPLGLFISEISEAVSKPPVCGSTLASNNDEIEMVDMRTTGQVPTIKLLGRPQQPESDPDTASAVVPSP